MTQPQSIPFARPWITDEEKKAVLKVLDGDILTHGPQNQAFEQEFAGFVGSTDVHCAAVSSCMAALHLAYWQMGIGPGDEVLVAAQTHVATAHAVEAVGARPVFIDCEPVTGNIDPDLLEQRITPRTKAIGLVHFLGIPCDMGRIMDIAQKHNLKVIEDCALAIGTRFSGRHVGVFGDAGCFSFYPVKHITTGDGGMFITRHKELAEKVKKARAFGVDRTFAERTIPGMYDVPTLGLNFRMSDINAALGRVQLSRVQEILKRRKNNYIRLKAFLTGIQDTAIIDARHTRQENSYYCLSVVLDGMLAAKRNQVVFQLNKSGVGTSVYYPQPVPRMSYYAKKYRYQRDAYPQAERISDQSIALPVGPHIGETEIDYIGKTFRKVIEEVS